MSRAALLRRLQPGVKLRLVYRSSDGEKNLPREVVRATTYSVYMKGSENPFTRVLLSKATIRATVNGFELLWPTGSLLRYEWAAGDQMELKGQPQ